MKLRRGLLVMNFICWIILAYNFGTYKLPQTVAIILSVVGIIVTTYALYVLSIVDEKN